MGIDWKKQDETEIAGRDALHGLACVMADHLTKESGEEWAGVATQCPAAWCRGDGPQNTRAGVFTRARDGFTLEVRQSLHHTRKDKGVAGIVWPKNPNNSGAACTSLRDAPSAGYNPPEPGFGFTLAKALMSPTALARRMLKQLTGPEMVEARDSIAARWVAETQRGEAAQVWREKVQEASGIECYQSQTNGEYFWKSSDKWAKIESANRGFKDAPGGKITITLPDDPDAAARMVASIKSPVTDYRKAYGESV